MLGSDEGVALLDGASETDGVPEGDRLRLGGSEIFFDGPALGIALKLGSSLGLDEGKPEG